MPKTASSSFQKVCFSACSLVTPSQFFTNLAARSRMRFFDTSTTEGASGTVDQVIASQGGHSGGRACPWANPVQQRDEHCSDPGRRPPYSATTEPLRSVELLSGDAEKRRRPP